MPKAPNIVMRRVKAISALIHANAPNALFIPDCFVHAIHEWMVGAGLPTDCRHDFMRRMQGWSLR
jgi:hypothetical protein